MFPWDLKERVAPVTCASDVTLIRDDDRINTSRLEATVLQRPTPEHTPTFDNRRLIARDLTICVG